MMAEDQCWSQLDKAHSHQGICETGEASSNASSTVSPTTQREGKLEGGGGVNEICLAGAVAFRKPTKQLQGDRETTL